MRYIEPGYQEGMEVLRPEQYANKESGEVYNYICGAFAWPGVAPGLAVIVAVEVEKAGKPPRFKVIEEAEEMNVIRLLSRCHEELTPRYGGLRTWFGDWQNGLSNHVYELNKNQHEGEEEDDEVESGFSFYQGMGGRIHLSSTIRQ